MENNLPVHIQAFLSSDFYPEKPSKIELIQTHISYIFACDEFVYKVKKPVDFGWVNYSTLEDRRLMCQAENDLNSRFSPDIYMGVLPVSFENGQYILGDSKNIIEYAVKMRRMPQENMLGDLLSAGKVQEQQIKDLAAYIVGIHKKIKESAPEQYGTYDITYKNAADNFPDITRNTASVLSIEDIKKVEEISLKMISDNRVLIEKRRANGYIKDLHGDLHASHVCFMENGPRLYDCIDFNPDFRCIDCAAEVAFLAMDLNSRGRADLSALFTEEYIKQSGDIDAARLIPMYKIYYALVRCKVASFELLDKTISPQQKEQAIDKVQSYFNLAYAGCVLDKPVLAITVGISGCGKSHFSSMLCKQAQLIGINSDEIRKELFGRTKDECCRTYYGGGIYSLEATQKTYQKMAEVTKEHLQKGHGVILDAQFGKYWQRVLAERTADENAVAFKIIEFNTPDETCLLNLAARVDGQSVSDGREDIFFEQKNSFETLKDTSEHAIISKLPTNHTVKEIIDYLAR